MGVMTSLESASDNRFISRKRKKKGIKYPPRPLVWVLAGLGRSGDGREGAVPLRERES